MEKTLEIKHQRVSKISMRVPCGGSKIGDFPTILLITSFDFLISSKNREKIEEYFVTFDALFWLLSLENSYLFLVDVLYISYFFRCTFNVTLQLDCVEVSG